ncbi:MAG: hypothetical protein M3124_07085 [Actinomycetota bacterium]|nr:hypothetical protein [Actinomycetota bacterium]
MHALISYDVARIMLDDRMRAAEQARLAHGLRTSGSRRHPLRSAVGRGLIALGARLSSQTQSLQHNS